MPIDSNIALGIRPVEQPNLINQMGQMYALRAAQQEYEGGNALRDFYAQGGDASTPEGRRALMSANPKLGKDILKAAAEEEGTRATTSKTKADTVKINIANSVASLASVNDVPSYIAWHEANHDPKINPAMASYFKTMGIDPNNSKAHIADVIAKLGPEAGLAQLKKESMGAVPELFKHLTQSEDNKQTNIQSNTNNIRTTGASIYGHNVTKQNNEWNQANPVMNQVTTDQGLGVTPNRGPNAGRIQPVYEPGAVPPPANALAPQQGLGQNSLASTLVTPPAAVPLSAMTGTAPTPAPAPAPMRAQPVQTGTMAGYRKLPNGNMEIIPGGPADPTAKAPEGYRRTPEGNLEFIPGGPKDPAVQGQQAEVKLSTKDLAAREAKYPQATTAIKGFEAKTAKFERDIDELIANEKGLNEITGFLAGRTELSAMSKEGRRALSLFNTITAKGGFSELQDMRNASPTGGALGNVSNQEGKQLIDSVGALSRTQDANDLRKSLNILKTDLQGSKQRVKDAYDMTYEYKGSGAGSQPNVAKEDPLGIR